MTVPTLTLGPCALDSYIGSGEYILRQLSTLADDREFAKDKLIEFAVAHSDMATT